MEPTMSLPAVIDLLGSVNVFATAINARMAEQLNEVCGDRITFAQLKVLKLVQVTDGLSISDVANFMGISNAAASKGVDRLVQSKLLRRTEAKDDRRTLEISLTPDAHELLDQYQVATNQELQKLFKDCSEERLQRMANRLDHLSLAIATHDTDVEEVCFRCGIYFRDKCLLRDQFEAACYLNLHRDNGSDSAAERGED